KWIVLIWALPRSNEPFVFFFRSPSQPPSVVRTAWKTGSGRWYLLAAAWTHVSAPAMALEGLRLRFPCFMLLATNGTTFVVTFGAASLLRRISSRLSRYVPIATLRHASVWSFSAVTPRLAKAGTS